MDVFGKVVGFVFLALFVFFVLKYLFPALGGLLGFLKAFLSFMCRALGV